MKIKIIIFRELYNDDKKNCPYAILTDEVKTFCTNLKSIYTNLANKKITHFEVKYKNTSKSQCIFIPHKCVNNGAFYKSHLGVIKGLDNSVNPINDCRLFYDKMCNRFTLIVPSYKDIKKIDNREPVVALDPGEKVFMAYHGTNTYGLIGNDIRKKILRQQYKIKKWQRLLSDKKNKGYILNKKGNKMKSNMIRKLKKRIRNAYNRIKNIVKELHNKTALYLCKNYEKILIPIFETQNMIKRKGTWKNRITEIFNKEGMENGKKELKKYNRVKRLNKRVKFVLNMLSHYKFRQHLVNKCHEYGCELNVVTEEYTSVTCTKCGLISKKCENRVKECEHCKYKINRDINGARNILIKNINIIL